MNAIVVEYEKRTKTVESLVALLHSLPHLKVRESTFDGIKKSDLLPNSETLKVMKEVKDGKTLKIKNTSALRSYLYA